ncbi:hypothetical protein DRW03_16275 [Corallococcus sp. H22C18031201]|nr:hypothetical protein DRW03_16275 [Corallococcus sp. H22C18031201]
MALLALACAPTTSVKAEAGEAAVRRFFAALPSRDCAVLGPMLATGGGARPCEDTVRELREHGLMLEEVLEAKVDGRDPNAVLVRARMSSDGAVRREPYLLRVEQQAGSWRLRL